MMCTTCFSPFNVHFLLKSTSGSKFVICSWRHLCHVFQAVSGLYAVDNDLVIDDSRHPHTHILSKEVAGICMYVMYFQDQKDIPQQDKQQKTRMHGLLKRHLREFSRS
jgi:hypothetical protein